MVILVSALIFGFISYHSPASQVSKENSSNDVTAYQGNTYTLDYPKSWQKISAPIADGTGTELYLQPANANPEIRPHVIVDVMDSRLTTLNKIVDPYVRFGYQKSEATVAGVPAQKFFNIVTSYEGTLHSTVYAFQANDTIYVLKLGYMQGAADPQLESEFAQMVRQFSLK